MFLLFTVQHEAVRVSQLEDELGHARSALLERMQQIELLNQRTQQLETVNQYLYNHLVLSVCRFREQEARLHHQLCQANQHIALFGSLHARLDTPNSVADSAGQESADQESSERRVNAKRLKVEPDS